jgi:hypothetical protein
MEAEINLLKENPAEHIIGKLNEVLAACTTLKARIDVMEDHLVFLLSKSPDYAKVMEAHAESIKAKESV